MVFLPDTPVDTVDHLGGSPAKRLSRGISFWGAGCAS